jgi:hypothetical protein
MEITPIYISVILKHLKFIKYSKDLLDIVTYRPVAR